MGKPALLTSPREMTVEELGMKYAQEWVGELVERKIPVTYVPSEDMYRYVTDATAQA